MDLMSKENRSYTMSRIRSTNTGIEKLCFSCLRKEKIHFVKHYKKVFGNPDIAVPSKKKAVFIHSDFWHGWQFPRWKHRLPKKYWQEKIERNRIRDRKNIAKLRSLGWEVLVIWSHELKENPALATKRLVKFLQ